MSSEVGEELSNKILAMDPISAQLPHTFHNGCMIEHITIKCAACSAELDAGKINGEWDIREHSAAIKGYGVCYECRTITPVEFRLDDEGGTMSKDIAGNWHTGTWSEKRNIFNSLISKIVRGFR